MAVRAESIPPGNGKHRSNWKPVFNILKSSFNLMLVNARHIKYVPGHKTDCKDSVWIAKLLSSGLLKGSFIPPEQVREMRDLLR
ncbi:IS110 family transposase [Chitinophaga ginsengisoli]|uniref:IS110 family transposase n=1 Tax=Chitinophaga ginsengisoli TaxID=363837 RepID=UPI0011B280CA